MSKKVRRSLLLVLLSIFALSACNDKGISIVHNDHNYDFTKDTKDDGQSNNDTGVSSGGKSTTFDNNDEKPNDIEAEHPIVVDDEDTATVIDNGTNIKIFNLSFVTKIDDGYVYLSYETDALDDKYNFSFYTVNDKDYKSENIAKVNYEGEDVYKVKIDDIKSGKYSIKFYDENANQYGRADFSISLPSTVSSSNFVVVSISVASVAVTTVFINIMNSFKKIGEFFANTFRNDRSMNIRS